MLLRERRGLNLDGFQTSHCTMWEKRTPQTFYEKVLHLGQQKAEHLDSFLLLSQNTKSFALYIIARNSDILFAPLLPCFLLHVLSIYLTLLPHLSSLLATPTNPLKTSLPISLWVSILANSWSTPLTSLSLKIEFVRSLRTPFYLRVLPRIPPSNDHCTHFLIFYFNPAQWLRHIPEGYTRHFLAETSCDTRLFEISAHGAWPHVSFRILKKSQSGDHP